MQAHQHAILVATGHDRPGVVDEIARFLFDRGGNIEDSRLMNLARQFALLARIGGDEAALATIRRDLPELMRASNLHADVQTIAPEATEQIDTIAYRFTATGRDQAGVLLRISHLLRVLNINIETVESSVDEPHLGDDQPPPFRLALRLSIPRETPIAMLKDYLKHLCAELGIEWSLEKAS